MLIHTAQQAFEQVLSSLSGVSCIVSVALNIACQNPAWAVHKVHTNCPKPLYCYQLVTPNRMRLLCLPLDYDLDEGEENAMDVAWQLDAKFLESATSEDAERLLNYYRLRYRADSLQQVEQEESRLRELIAREQQEVERGH